jgi:flagellar biosynthesis/type III secretory pathway M-ring protein FliF/YscJ
VEAESALKNAMGIHPNRPDLEITMVPFPSHEQQEQEQEVTFLAQTNYRSLQCIVLPPF